MIIDTYEAARAALPHLSPEAADAVLDYSVGDGRREPVTLEVLRDNADHLAEEESA